jgi:hypothetical protein
VVNYWTGPEALRPEAKSQVSSVLPSSAKFSALFVSSILTDLGDTPQLGCLLPLGAQKGGLWSKWEPVQPMGCKVLVAINDSWYTKKGSFKNESNSESNN